MLTLRIVSQTSTPLPDNPRAYQMFDSRGVEIKIVNVWTARDGEKLDPSVVYIQLEIET